MGPQVCRSISPSMRSVAFELENIGNSGDLACASETFSRLEKEYDRLYDFAQNIH